MKKTAKGQGARTLWWGLGALVGALTGLYLWRRRQIQAVLPPVFTARGKGVALITGASSGIGAAFAERLAREGYALVLVARRRDRLEALAAQLTARHGVAVEVFPADLANFADVERLTQRVAGLELDILVNNAGFGTSDYFVETEAEQLAAMLRVHAEAATRLARAALPGLLARKRGAIINVASVAAFYPLPRSAVYGPSKAYLVGFSEALSVELAGTGVRVQALCPGFTRTEFQEVAAIESGGLPDFVWLSPEYVVEQSLRDLRAGVVISTPGLGYKALVLAARFMPRWIVYWVGGHFQLFRRRELRAERGTFAAFPRRKYESLAQMRSDMRYMRAHRAEIRRAMRALAPKLRERLMLTVTEVNGCRYCAHYHAKLALEGGLTQAEIDEILCGSAAETCAAEEQTAVLYAQHWADADGNPDATARAKLVETYGAELAQSIEIALHMIKMGNYMGNTWDYFLWRISGGRWGGVSGSRSRGS